MTNDKTMNTVDAEDHTAEAATPGPDTHPAPQDRPDEQRPETDTTHTDTDGDDDGEPRSKEAARYRRRLRDTEQERDALAKQVTALQREAIEGIATGPGRLRTAEPLWAGGAALPDLLTDTGTVDREKVLSACDDVAERFGVSRRRPNSVPGEGANPRPEPTRTPTDVVMGR